MDKIAIERVASSPVSPGSPTASHASSSASLGNGHKTHGVQKFCSKIRHKIEDNIAPRLAGKLYKSHKHSISMSSLNNVDSTSGKYTAISKQSTLPPLPAKVDQQTGTSFSSSSAHRRLTGMLKHQRQRIGKSTKVLNKREISAPIGKVATNSGIICPALKGKGNVVDTVVVQEPAPNSLSSFESGTYVDSDEEYQLSLNLTKQSLEDEIFEELEKAAHDESKLNAVLKNFDRLLTDYNGQPVIVSEEVEKTMQRVECDVAVVEAAAAAQLELLALEPPVAFADNEIENKKGSDEVDKASTTVEAATNVAEKPTEPMLEILEAKTAPVAAQIPQVVELEIKTLTHKQTMSQLLPAVSPGKSVDVVVFDCPVISSQICSNIDDNSLATASAGVSDSTSLCSAPTATTSTEDSFTPPQPPVRPKRLEKSKSSLAIPRRNAYQSSDTPTLRNIRYALAARSRSKSVWELTPNSAAAAANSKIPIFKALPLQKRSNSFCSTSLTEVIDKEKLIGTKKLVVEKRGGVNESATASKDLTVANLNQRRQLTMHDARSVSALSLGGKARSRSLSTTRTQQTPLSTSIQQQQQQTQSTAAQRVKRQSGPVEKLTRSNSRLQMERTKSSIGFNSTTLSTMGTRRTPSSISLSSSQHTSPSVSRAIALNSTGARKLHRSRDELLDKCLEKGQEILRKVESINTEGGVRKTTIATALKTSGKAATLKTTTTATQPKRATSTTATAASSRTKVKTACSGSVALTGKITKDACNGTLRRTRVSPTNATTNISPTTATATKQLKYANEEKVPQPQLEFCKIIPPVLGETSDKHTELLVNVVQAKLSNAPPSGCKPSVTQQLPQHQEANNLKEQLAAATKVDNSYQTLHSAAPIEKLIKVDEINHINESDSDDSGHISNENDTTIHTLSTSTTSSVSLCESDIIEEEKSQQQTTAYKASNQNPISTHCKSNKISELLEKFEKQSHASVQSSAGEQNIRATPTKVCTATRVAQLEAVQCIQTQVEFYPTYSKEILFRSGVLSELEAKRDELLSDRIIQLQAYCRGYLARKQVARRRVQELAVRCIQRNVKAFLAVRDWPWWRLLVRVTPLLNVHRTEEQLKLANEELAMLRTKLEKIENDRNELKTDNQKLEAKPPLVLTAEREDGAEKANEAIGGANASAPTVSSLARTAVSGVQTPLLMPHTTNTASVKSKIPTVDTGINGTAKLEQIKRSAERGSETVKLQSRRLVTAKQTGNDIKSGDASTYVKSTKIINSNNIGTAITNGSSTSSNAAPIETKTHSEKTVFKEPKNTLDTLETKNSTSNTKQTSTSKSANTIQLNSKTDTHTTTQSLYNSKPQATTCSSINIETKQTTLSGTHTVNQKSSDNSKFLERVLEAMRSSKPQNSIGLTKPSTFVLSSKATKITSSSSAANSGPLSPPPTTNGGGHPNPLSNGGGSTSSLSSNASVSTNASSRPPVPPQSQQRARKQVDLLSKQRERSTSSYASDSTTTTRRSQQNYDSEDGLLMPDMKYQSSYQNRVAKSSTNTTITNGTASSTKSYLSNGYGSSGISSAVSSASSLSSRISGNVKNPSTAASETAFEVSLKLPLSKSDFLSTTGSSGNAIRNSASERLRSLSQRSPSPALSTSSRCSSFSSSINTNNTTTPRATPARLTTPPRRVFPQTYTRGDPLNIYQMHNLEQSPVVFDANLSFVLGCKKQPVHQTLRASPSYEDPQTTSAYLSEKIQNFLRRTDHVQEEWTAMGKRTRRMGSVGTTGSVAGSLDSGRTTPTNSVYDDDTINLIERQRERNSMERCSSVGRSRSSQNILTKAFQLTKTLPHTPTSRSNSMARELSETDDDHTIQEEDDNDMDELSEMTVDLAEERSTANIATERLEAETAERLKLEKELNEQQTKVKNLQETSEKLEMELICAKSDLNGISEDEDPENEEGGSGVYKLKYERVARELEFTKRRLQTQHEHDLEQLVGLKKQLEKKLSDAYEEVEEQRQVVGQWKRKAQKMTNEMNDLRMLLEEQNGRNNLLEKKQRKFDAECQSLQDAARLERQTKDRLSREKDVLIAEKFTLEQTLADTRLELELKEEKLASLQRELEEMTFGGSTEEEIAQLRRSKNELDRRVKEQEEELDEMAGQVQLLEQAKLRLEMTLETMRKDARREAQQRDDELEEARNSSYKKLKALECQLETEHEERTLLLREKHELERRLSSMEDQDRMDRQAEEAATQKLKRDLRKYKALLKDAQAQLERSKAETPGKALIRQLRNQLEDAESARALVMKARQAAEAELAEVQAMFEESQKGRNDAEERANAAHRDRAELQAQIEENEEELAELMKKYSAAVKQLNTEQIAASEYEFKLSELEAERNNLKEQVSELQQRLENVENMADPSTAMLSKRLELRTKELESRLDLEQATRTRLEVQVSRLKETLEKVQNDVAQAKGREMQAQDALKKSQKSLRDMREEYHVVAGREQESVTKRKDLEKKLEQVESESSALKNDLRLALQRIADLQQAMEEGDDDVSDSEDSRSTEGSLSDLEERLRPIKVKRTTNGELMSPSTTKTLVHEKDDNSPRITLTSPSSPHIHKLAKQANAVADAKASDATTRVGGDKKATTNSISTEKSSESLKNGDAASYA